jgi:hypothetical protein
VLGLGLVLALPVLYVLSVGPALWLVAHEWIDETCVAAYAPLDWASEHSTIAHDWLNSYLLWWKLRLPRVEGEQGLGEVPLDQSGERI